MNRKEKTEIHKLKNSATIKRRLVEAGIPSQCAICGLIPEWNGMHLVLQLDHIDGNHNNNYLENLRLICPNCHSQTPTFTGRNVNPGQKRLNANKCSCGASISSYSVTCRKCMVRRTKINWPPYEEVLRLVTDSSLSAVGRELGVSDNAVKKWLRAHKPQE